MNNLHFNLTSFFILIINKPIYDYRIICMIIIINNNTHHLLFWLLSLITSVFHIWWWRIYNKFKLAQLLGIKRWGYNHIHSFAYFFSFWDNSRKVVTKFAIISVQYRVSQLLDLDRALGWGVPAALHPEYCSIRTKCKMLTLCDKCVAIWCYLSHHP